MVNTYKMGKQEKLEIEPELTSSEIQKQMKVLKERIKHGKHI